MTFGAHHYVPVLKVKRGEKRALRLLSSSVRTRVTPLLEIVERTDKPMASHLDNTFKDLANAVRPFGRCFIDAREIESDGPAAAEEVFTRATASGIVFAPVTGISRTSDVAAAMANRSHGLVIRINRSELEAGGLRRSLQQFMHRNQLAPEQTDLVMDLGAVNDLVQAGVEALADAFLTELPEHIRWRTFTLSSCAFPTSMGVVDRHSNVLVERSDWLMWRDGYHARRHSLTRLPTYSDGAIQHPLGVEGFDPRTMQISASIRYTVPEAWLLIKGESTRFTPPSMQFPTLASQLVYGHLHSCYRGRDHCPGCASIKAAADGAPRLGSPEAWRRLGTIHHITTVVQELDALTWP